jgi:hypothetical protein
MCLDSSGAPHSKSCDNTLDGHLLGLHVVHNSRTKERLVVGGADDGSVAVWGLEYVPLCSESDKVDADRLQ